ncbi:MAG TPA: tripartite tricarboxylate transporter substrate binding protein, partial [Ramlibacter sp.]|nr:tripartite tricarboxylate transporter substrate binding protein [Ramlibacter sp.]
MNRRNTLRLLGAALTSLLAVAMPMQQAQAADPFPSRPVRFIVPLGPGSGSDTITRLVARLVTPELNGQSTFIEN